MADIKNRLIPDSLKIFEATISYKIECECGNIYRRNKRIIRPGGYFNVPIDKSKCPECKRDYVFGISADVYRTEEIVKAVGEEHREVLERSMEKINPKS